MALARALAFEPQVLLLDEPLSALDAKIRVSLRQEIRSIQRQLGITTVYVTHDQEEALSLSDRIVVMSDGNIEQIGTPFEVYNTPSTPFVARFVGTLSTLNARVIDAATRRVKVGDAEIIIDASVGASGSDIALALAQQISGDPVAADAALKNLVDNGADAFAYQIAQVYALRNDSDKVFEWLDHAWAHRDTGVGQLLYDPFIIRYKHDPRFAAYCKKAGLPVPGEPATAKATPAANPAQTATPAPASGQVP